jgi:hypothetical protein
MPSATQTQSYGETAGRIKTAEKIAERRARGGVDAVTIGGKSEPLFPDGAQSADVPKQTPDLRPEKRDEIEEAFITYCDKLQQQVLDDHPETKAGPLKAVFESLMNSFSVRVDEMLSHTDSVDFQQYIFDNFPKNPARGAVLESVLAVPAEPFTIDRETDYVKVRHLSEAERRNLSNAKLSNDATKEDLSEKPQKPRFASKFYEADTGRAAAKEQEEAAKRRTERSGMNLRERLKNAREALNKKTQEVVKNTEIVYSMDQIIERESQTVHKDKVLENARKDVVAARSTYAYALNSWEQAQSVLRRLSGVYQEGEVTLENNPESYQVYTEMLRARRTYNAALELYMIKKSEEDVRSKDFSAKDMKKLLRAINTDEFVALQEMKIAAKSEQEYWFDRYVGIASAGMKWYSERSITQQIVITASLLGGGAALGALAGTGALAGMAVAGVATRTLSITSLSLAAKSLLLQHEETLWDREKEEDIARAVSQIEEDMKRSEQSEHMKDPLHMLRLYMRAEIDGLEGEIDRRRARKIFRNWAALFAGVTSSFLISELVGTFVGTVSDVASSFGAEDSANTSSLASAQETVEQEQEVAIVQESTSIEPEQNTSGDAQVSEDVANGDVEQMQPSAEPITQTETIDEVAQE